MARFDVETLLEKLESKLKVSLNQKLSAINTEKGDSLLEPIPDKAWIFGSLDDRAKNFKDFVFYYVDTIDTKVAGSRTSEEYTIEIDLFLFDRQDEKIQKRILRTHRALRESVVETWEKVGIGIDRVEVESLVPIDVKLNNSSFYHKILGVSLKCAIHY